MSGSPWFWVVVGILTAGFALVDLEALRRRSLSRLHGVAVAAYVLAWGSHFVYGLPVRHLGSLSYIIPFAACGSAPRSSLPAASCWRGSFARSGS